MTTAINPLVILLLIPLVGGLILWLIPASRKNMLRWVALVTSLTAFGTSLWMLAQFDADSADLQMVVKLPWMNFVKVAVNFEIGVDGLSILMVLLTTVLTSISILSSWTAVQEKVKGFMAFFLLLEVGMLGVFLAQDMILFYVFWEFTLIPMYFLIGIWGGERKIYAAVKFFLFTMAGSVLMLAAILWLGVFKGTFSVPELTNIFGLLPGTAWLLFLAFALAFAIKVPMFPLHTWLPDAHVEAPTAGSVILAGVLLKMGAYGFLRFNLPLFPEIAIKAAPWFAFLAVVGIIYGAATAFMQKDVKKLVAYSSVSHLGFVMLGIFALNPLGLQGAILQMVNHGLSTGALFLIVGMIYERRHTRLMSDFGGLWKVMPVFGTLSLVIVLSSVGLPGLNGFVGEFTILTGAYTSVAINYTLTAILATVGVILAAVYLLHMFQHVYLGTVTHDENKSLKDVNWREIITLAPLLALILWIGVYPKPFFALMAPAVNNLVALMQPYLMAVK
ncbi:MAG: Fe-S-binding domain-containing protein [Anaerolinea sp.]|nr:Fe-S-binding domain-containing protein [Anaerolinea sp.]